MKTNYKKMPPVVYDVPIEYRKIECPSPDLILPYSAKCQSSFFVDDDDHCFIIRNGCLMYCFILKSSCIWSCEAHRINRGVVRELQLDFTPGVKKSNVQIAVDGHQPSTVERPRPAAAPSPSLRGLDGVYPLLGEARFSTTRPKWRQASRVFCGERETVHRLLKISKITVHANA